MKKYALIVIAALAMAFAACGEKEGEKAENGKNAKTETKANVQDVAKSEAKTDAQDVAKAEPTYITYTNDKYGFTVEVPSGMTQRGESMGEEGTVFSLENENEALTFNRIDISGDENWNGDYTIEGVIEALKEWHDFSEFTNVQTGDNYFTYAIPGEYVTQIDYYVINGPKMVMMSVCYEPGFEKELGGEVAEHVFKSVKFK